LKPEGWGAPLVQKQKYQGKGNKWQMMMMMMMIIIIIQP
jgi:hypothetical protein